MDLVLDIIFIIAVAWGYTSLFLLLAFILLVTAVLVHDRFAESRKRHDVTDEVLALNRLFYAVPIEEVTYATPGSEASRARHRALPHDPDCAGCDWCRDSRIPDGEGQLQGS